MLGKRGGCQSQTQILFVPRQVLKIVILDLFVGVCCMLTLVAKVMCVVRIDPFTLFKK